MKESRQTSDVPRPGPGSRISTPGHGRRHGSKRNFVPSGATGPGSPDSVIEPRRNPAVPWTGRLRSHVITDRLMELGRPLMHFIFLEVLRFRRVLGLMLGVLVLLVPLAVMCAVAVPRFSRVPKILPYPDGYFELGPPSGPDWRWRRLEEVADGIRPFGAEDRESFHRQRPAIDRLVDWFSQDDFWRRVKRAPASRTQRWTTHLEEILAITFHLDGLDASSRVVRHGIVLEAALRYVEDLARHGLGAGVTNISPALAADERLLRQLLRHVAREPRPREEIDRWIRRLEEHFACVGDLRIPPADTGMPARTFDLARAGQDPSAWPWRPEKLRYEDCFTTYPLTSRFACEKIVFFRALRMEPGAALVYLEAQQIQKDRARLKERPWPVTVLHALTLSFDKLPSRRESPWARGAYLRHLEWTALRRGVLAALRMQLRSSPPGRAQVSTDPRRALDPFTGGSLFHSPGDVNFHLRSAGPDGIDQEGAGDDLPIWPPAPVQSPALRALHGGPLPDAPGSPSVSLDPALNRAGVRFAGPESALLAVARRVVELRLRAVRLRVLRPDSTMDLQRARVEVVVEKERFHRLVPLLEAPEVAALGGRGEMNQLEEDLRQLSFDVLLPVASGAPSTETTIITLPGRDPVELCERLAAEQLRQSVTQVKTVEIVRAGRGWVLVARCMIR